MKHYSIACVFFVVFLSGCAPITKSVNGTRVTQAQSDGSCSTMNMLRASASYTCGYLFRTMGSPILVSSTEGACGEGRAISAVFDCGGGTGASSNSNNSIDSTVAVSRLELRTMQTRKFKKSPAVVIKAISELNKDKGNKCVGIAEPKYTCQGSLKNVVVGNSTIQKCIAPDGVSSGLVKTTIATGDCSNTLGLNANYEIDTNFPANTETIVRIRLSNSSTPQVTDPQQYSRLFKEIADGLFIDAVELTPAEMQ